MPLVGPSLERILVLVDSLLLVAAVLRRRAGTLGLGAIMMTRPPLPPRALYVDCGTHDDGLQVALVSEWLASRLDLQILAFEANPATHATAVEALKDVPNLDLRNEALVSPDQVGSTVRLFMAGGTGAADSLFAERQDGAAGHVEVPAVRLSHLIRQHPDRPVLLRMNIEGAESFVIEDLVEASMTGSVAGYYGMWDDLYKIDPDKDAEFRSLLARTGIRTITFNDRDLDFPLRLWAIHYDMLTSLGAAA